MERGQGERLAPYLLLAWTAALALALAVSAVAGIHNYGLSLREDEARPATMQRIEWSDGGVMATDGEYLPRNVHAKPWDLSLAPAPPAGTPAQVRVREVGLFIYKLDVEPSTEPTYLILDRFAYPGWRAWADSAETSVRATAPLGLLTVDVPPNTRQLRVEFRDTPVRFYSGLVSGLTLAALLVGGALYLWRRQPRDRRLPLALAVVGTLALGLTWSGLTGLAEVAERVIPVNADFGPSAGSEPAPSLSRGHAPVIRLVGATVGAPDPSGRLPLTLHWQARERVGRDYVVSLRLLDANGRVVGRRDKAPRYGLRPTSGWERGELVRDQQEIALDTGVPAGEYTLVMALTTPDSDSTLPPAGAEGLAWEEDGRRYEGVALGPVRMPARPAPPPARLDHALPAQFGSHVALEGFSVGVNGGPARASADPGRYLTVLRPGERLDVCPRWRTLRDFADDLRVFTHLSDSRTGVVAQYDSWPHHDFLPTTLWLPGDVVDDSLWMVAPNLPLGRYTVSIGWYRRADMLNLLLVTHSTSSVQAAPSGAKELTLGVVKVAPDPPLTPETVRPQHWLEAAPSAGSGQAPSAGSGQALGGQARLFGWDVKPDAPRPGDAIRLTLYWQALRPPERDYTVFVHLLSPNGNIAAQADGQPGQSSASAQARGDYPTSLWEEGEVVLDSHDIALPANLAPGTYRLQAGLYRLDTGARLALPDGREAVPLGEVTVW